ERQIGSITYQQAEKDFSIGEFYRRTGHPGSAYFYYEIVRRRYPGSKWADMATDRMQELRTKVGQERMAEPSMFDGGMESVDRVLGRKKKLDPELDDDTPRLSPTAQPAPPRSLPSDLAPR